MGIGSSANNKHEDLGVAGLSNYDTLKKRHRIEMKRNERKLLTTRQTTKN